MTYSECDLLRMGLLGHVEFLRDCALMGVDLGQEKRTQLADKAIRIIDQMKAKGCSLYTKNTDFFEALRIEIQSKLFADFGYEDAVALITEIDKRER